MRRRSSRKVPLGVQDSSEDEYQDAVMQVDQTLVKSNSKTITARSSPMDSGALRTRTYSASFLSPPSQSRKLGSTDAENFKVEESDEDDYQDAEEKSVVSNGRSSIRSTRRKSSKIEAPATKSKRAKASAVKKQKKFVEVDDEEEKSLHQVKESNTPMKLYGYEDQLNQLTALLKSSIEGIESNSVIICGPHGSGKSALLGKSLEDVKESTGAPVEIVSLSGYLDTNPINLFKSVRETIGAEEPSISMLLEELLEKSKSDKKALFFILDAFDMFCRKNQTFLYNIFDLSQKCTSVAVVGMTSRLDCLELLEKRVKSRMSQTVIHLNSPFSSLYDYTEYAKSLDVFEFADKKVKKKYLDTVTKTAALQYGMNTSIGHMKRFLIQTACEVMLSSTEKEDPIISTVTSLSHLELLILVMAFKYCKVRNIDTLPCNALVTESAKFSGRTKISRQVVYQLIQNLLACGLFVKSSHSKSSCGFINDWSMLAVNIREEDLRRALNKLQSTLPASLHSQVILN
jgi:hypothetical protein